MKKKIVSAKRSTKSATTATGLSTLMGKQTILLCANYFYAGVLVAVTDDEVTLDSARLVYETGPWNGVAWQDAQLMGDSHYVFRHSIESYRAGK